jgi:hypothetical protein
MKFSLKKIMCGLLCGALLLTVGPAQASWYTNFFTQKNALISCVVAGVTLGALWAWKNWGTPKKPTQTQSPGTLDVVKTEQEKSHELLMQIVRAIEDSELAQFQQLIQTNKHALLWQDANGATVLMYAVRKLDKKWLVFVDGPANKEQQVN